MHTPDTDVRVLTSDKNGIDNTRTRFVLQPYHIRLKHYIEAREKLFSDATLDEKLGKKYRRSTVRMRNFYKKLKRTRKLFISTIFINENDGRL